MNEPTDSAIVQRVIAGDVEAFALLVDRYHARMARYAFQLLGSEAEAEEAVQDSFVRAYRSLSTYREQERFGAWILRILVNRCRTRLVRDKRREEVAAAWVREAEQPFEPSERLAMRDELAVALAQLPDEQRAEHRRSCHPARPRCDTRERRGFTHALHHAGARAGAEINGSAQSRAHLIGKKRFTIQHGSPPEWRAGVGTRA